MDSDFERLIQETTAQYEGILIGKSQRICNGRKLWRQFESAIESYKVGGLGSERQLHEKINELAVAKVLSDDPNISGRIIYEPNILPSKKKIDFVVERSDDNLYVEVKSVCPAAVDSDQTWQKYLTLRKHHPQNANMIVRKDWMGGMIYANTFASRSKFLQYSIAFEERLEEAQGVKIGPGILVFCGTGFQWHVDELEDFADFYRLGKHRVDDPFALMEQYEIEKEGIDLRRNISEFSFVQRCRSEAAISAFHFPVRGPKIGQA